MSGLPQVRRADKLMKEVRAREVLEKGFCGRLATVGADGWPYCVPLLYVLQEGDILVHNTRAKGHLRENVDHEPRVCFEVDEPGEVFPYGRFECDSSVAYASSRSSRRERAFSTRSWRSTRRAGGASAPRGSIRESTRSRSTPSRSTV